jgi:hypothetical protein
MHASIPPDHPTPTFTTRHNVVGLVEASGPSQGVGVDVANDDRRTPLAR